MSEAVCNASRPPAYKRTAAMADMSPPHMIFADSGGDRLPYVVILARIYVAESADVTRKVRINIMDTNESNPVKGRCSNITKSAVVKSASTAPAMSVPLFKSSHKAVPPSL